MIRNTFSRRWHDIVAQQRLRKLSADLTRNAALQPEQAPVVFFNASTRLGNFSQNAAFSLLAAMSVHAAGTPVVHFACTGGMTRCMLGTNPDDVQQPPPCALCRQATARFFHHAPVVAFGDAAHPEMRTALQGLGLAALADFSYPFEPLGTDIPLGVLTLPGLRWALRRYHLQDDEATRFLWREYIFSAYALARAFYDFVHQVAPQAVVLFNGIAFPEATARWVAQSLGLRVITHEVSYLPFSAFFSAEAPAPTYPLHIPEDFQLDEAQNARLDAYLSQRFKGAFTMAGIRFWPEMQGLDEAFLQKAAQFRQIVPVFTNVIYDTSQVHANTLFEHMFAWLDALLPVMRAHPEALFVIRAHPDEMRPGTRKQAREHVQGWVAHHRVTNLPNVVFVGPLEYLSSYDLIRRSKLVLVYNSSIGLEATLLGAPVLAAGAARYTDYEVVHYPADREGYMRLLERFLSADEIPLPEAFAVNARRFLYYQLFKASLPFGDFLEPGAIAGAVRLKAFPWRQLREHPTTRLLMDGILHGKSFLLEN
ncbi:MAG: hypothetical protein Fur0018_06950 [Anaerolineales bacterium]